MSRTQSNKWFRTRLEKLETREMMAADTSVPSIAAFLASATNLSPVAAAYPSVSAAGPSSSASSGGAAASAAASAAGNANTQYGPVGADWFSANLVDATLRDSARSAAGDGTLNRGDMLGLFNVVKNDGVISSNEYADLQKIVGQSSLFVGYDYVRVLSTDVVASNPANAQFQGQGLGNLAAGSSASRFDKLVQKWFWGADHPVAMTGTTYRLAADNPFPHAPVYSDIIQGSVGDCYLLSSLGEAALRDPNLITSMFIVNGDGTYTIRFYNNGKADYVTVDTQFAFTSQGNYVYANMGQSISNRSVPIWAALIEKAYAQMNESGWLRAAFSQTGSNRYDAISGGYMTDTLRQITSRNATFGTVGQSSFEAAWNSGSLITFGSFSKPYDSSVVGNHGYAVVGYNSTTKLVTVFNPWGVNNRYSPGLVTIAWAQMTQDFFAMEYTT